MEGSHIVLLILAITTGLVTYTTYTAYSEHSVTVSRRSQEHIFRSEQTLRQSSLEERTIINETFQEDNSNRAQRLLELHYFKFKFCHICLETVELINIHLNTNATFNKFRKQAIGICHKVASISNYFDDIVCDGFIDNYGPPVLYILDQNILDPPTVCQHLGYCVPNISKIPEVMKTEGTTNTETNNRVHSQYPTGDKPAKTLKVLQLSDIHVDKNYKPGSASHCDTFLCCHEETNGTEPAGYYGDYSCDIPWWTVDVLIDSIKQMDPQPDFIIYTGDSPPHDVWKETWASQLSVDADVVDYLDDRFDGINIYPTIGNHETFPANLYYSPLPEYQRFNRENYNLWNNLFPVPKNQRMNIKKAAYYSVLVKPGLRILSLNTNYGYTLNFYTLLNWKNPSRDEQHAFMAKTLEKSRLNGEKVIIIGHVPPGDVPNTLSTYGIFYSDLVTRYRDVIVLQLFGHTHNDQYEVVLPKPGDTREASGVVFIAPSVTTFTSHNPAYRIYHLDPETFLPIDYDQYYLNLTKANQNSEAKVEHLYSAKQEYSLPDLSPESFLDLSKRFLSNETLFQRYVKNKYAGNDFIDNCDSACKHITVCESLSSSTTAWLNCVANIKLHV